MTGRNSTPHRERGICESQPPVRGLDEGGGGGSVDGMLVVRVGMDQPCSLLLNYRANELKYSTDLNALERDTFTPMFIFSSAPASMAELSSVVKLVVDIHIPAMMVHRKQKFRISAPTS